MEKSNDLVFQEYEDLYKLTSKTADDHIEFYKKRESLSYEDLFSIWKKLSKQADNFDERNWAKNWHNWEKNYHAFEKHKFEARFLIQHYLTDVLEELVTRLSQNYEKYLKSTPKREYSSQMLTKEISDLIKTEVKRMVKQELKNQQRRKKI